MEWVRGETIGRGSFAKVDLAISKSGEGGVPPLMAVKSAPVYNSETLKHEREILGMLANSENVIQCFGDSLSCENGERVYNIFLEYASQGSLFDRVRKCSDRLSESEVRRYTRSVLSGLKDVHSNGFVHCDVKLQNMLLFSDNYENDVVVAKIADFGLAKRQNIVSENRHEFRGTPLYTAPETVVSGEFESPADIWAVGCAVVEMLTGAPAWKNESNIASLLLKISQQLPEIPANLSPEIRDFLDKCFIRDAAKRWTAEMLLDHQFLAAEKTLNSTSPKTTTSPRCPFDFPEFITSTPNSQSGFDSWIEKDGDCTMTESSENAPAARFRQLVSEQVPNWVFSSSWLIVR